MIYKDIEENKKNIAGVFNFTSDLVLYEFSDSLKQKVLIVYIEGLIDVNSLNENIIKPLKNIKTSRNTKSLVDSIKLNIDLIQQDTIKNLRDSIEPLTNGSVVIFIDSVDLALSYNLAKWDKRPVEKPENEASIRGPKEAFIEDIYTNKVLIRRIVKNNDLIFEDYKLGKVSNTNISLVYIKGIVNEDVLTELKDRLSKIDTDIIIDSGNIEYYIDDNVGRIFSSVSYTERPDVVVGKITEGRIGVICDGSPNVITAPKLFIENLHTVEDYYIKSQYATFLRLIRLISFFISFTFPAIYLSLVLFHQEMIPSDLLVAISAQREGVPFSAPLELLIMTLFFDTLKEAAIRLPNPLGQTITLVGGLIIGQAAVDAGIVSSILVVVVAVSGMTEFAVPNLREMITIYRLALILFASFIGLYGVSLALVAVGVQLVSIKSFGVPYMWPMAPWNLEAMKDSILKFPIQSLKQRPKVLSNNRKRRRDRGE